MNANPLYDLQRQRNANSRGAWDAFASHRQRVTQLLIEAARTHHSPTDHSPTDSPSAGRSGAESSEGARLCILGAGNSNDLDLKAITRAYREVHLVDLDGEALAAGVMRQPEADGSRIVVHGNIDLTGVFPQVSGWSPQSPPDESGLRECFEQAAARVLPPLPGPFDTVASVCVLSQLIEPIILALGNDHPRMLELLSAVRLRHLQQIVELLRPGGCGLLMTDMVSSATCPELATISDDKLPRLLERLVAARDFFTGLNPGVLLQLFRSDCVLCRETTAIEVLRPWRWDLGPRIYAVFGFRFRRIRHQGCIDGGLSDKPQ